MKEVAAITLEAAAKHYRTAAGWVRAVDAIDVVIESGTSVPSVAFAFTSSEVIAEKSTGEGGMIFVSVTELVFGS